MMNFNIQLFADAQTNTTGTMSVEMKTFYEKRLIDQAEPRLVHDQFADYYPVPQNGGKTIEFRKDSITRDVLAGGTNVIYAPKLGADGAETAVTSRKALDKSCTLTPKLFFQAAAQLGAMNADPIGDSYVAIIHPYAAYDLKTCKEFTAVWSTSSSSWATATTR